MAKEANIPPNDLESKTILFDATWDHMKNMISDHMKNLVLEHMKNLTLRPYEE